jgi:flavin-dependent thymidylate synthase
MMNGDGAVSKEVQRYADVAMYDAEPIDRNDDGSITPKVYLLGMTSDPLGHIAAACKMYKGEVVRDLSEISDDERRDYFEQVQRTHLQAPFEFVDFHFMVEGVTRSLTHQMVRQRTAVYAQESLRFAVKPYIGDEVALPPSLIGTDPTRLSMHTNHGDTMRLVWDEALDNLGAAYHKLVGMGMPQEDARGLLPHNIATRLHYKTNLRNLLEHAGNRLCTQAQFEWRTVWIQIVQAIREYRVVSPSGHRWKSDAYDWQQDVLANLFRPICYLTGKCEFRADFDRACSIRDRVDQNAAVGRPSAQWDTHYGDDETVIQIRAIRPSEWLLDPAAARVRG